MSRKPRGTNRIVLNDRKLGSIKPARGEARTEYWDSSLAGFGVRVAVSGRKTFTVRYGTPQTYIPLFLRAISLRFPATRGGLPSQA